MLRLPPTVVLVGQLARPCETAGKQRKRSPRPRHPNLPPGRVPPAQACRHLSLPSRPTKLKGKSERASGQHAAQGGRGRSQDTTRRGGACGESMVNLTVGNRSGLTGNRSNRSGPVPVPTGSQPVQIQILNLNSKK